MPLGIYPTVDYVFKRLFGDPENADLLIHLLNAVLRPKVPIVAVWLENPFLEKEFEDDKWSVLDIRASDQEGRKFNVEMQTTLSIDLPKRLLYYLSRIYGSQLEESDSYAILRPAISICFLSMPMFPDVLEPHLRFEMSDVKHGLVFSDQLQVHTIELSKYNWNVQDVASADDLSKWTFFLRNAASYDAAELRQLLPGLPYAKATGVIEMISHSPEQRRLHDARLRAQRDELSLKEWAERGAALGEARGEVRGKICLLQELLNEPLSDQNELAALSLDELYALAAQLRIRFEGLRAK